MYSRKKGADSFGDVYDERTDSGTDSEDLDTVWIKVSVPFYPWVREEDETGEVYYLNTATDEELDDAPDDWDEILSEHSGESKEYGVSAGQTVDDVLQAGLGAPAGGEDSPRARPSSEESYQQLRPKSKTLKRLGAAAAGEVSAPLGGDEVIVESAFVAACVAAGVRPSFLVEKALPSTRPTEVLFFEPGGGAPIILKIPASHTLADLKAELHARTIEALGGRKFAKLKKCTLKVAHHRAFANRGYLGESQLEGDPAQLVRDCSIARFCAREHLTPKFSLVENKFEHIRLNDVRESQIERLVGQRVSDYSAPEVLAFRRMHRNLRLSTVSRTASVTPAEPKPGTRSRRRTKTKTKTKAGSSEGSKLLDVPGPQETLDLGEPAAHLKESSLFELHLTFMTIDEHGEARDAGDGVVQLCDHSMRMMQLLEDVACDTLQAPHEWICKARGYDEWLVGDKPLIDYRYIRGRLEKKLPVFLQALPRQEIVAREFKRLAQDHIAEMAIQKQVDQREAERDQPPPQVQMNPDDPKHKWTCVPIWHLTKMFTVRVCNAAEVVLPKSFGQKKPKKGATAEPGTLYVQMGMYHGGPKGVITECKSSEQPANIDEAITWEETLETTVAIKVLPRATVLSFTLMHKASADEEPGHPVAWVNMHVFDHTGILVTGRQTLRMWPSLSADDMANPIGTCVEDLESPNPMLLTLEFDLHRDVFERLGVRELPICKYTWGADTDTGQGGRRQQPTPAREEEEHLRQLTESDPLTQPSDDEKRMLYKYRHSLKHKPEALPKLMLAIDWMDPDQIREGRRMLKQWAPLSPTQALDLLDARYADLEVRKYAVKCLEGLSDTELELYMPQLIQTLKYDPYHDSALSGFIMKRALRNPSYIGHLFFWSLKAEVHIVEIRERYSLLIDEFLRGCGLYRKQLTQQHWVVTKLEYAALRLKKVKAHEERLAVLHRDLEALNKELPREFELPLDPKLKLRRLRVEKCRYMDSKKLPLWLVFENADPLGEDYYVIFKEGDDLRQDVLTLQMIRIMDRLWQAEGLDLKLSPYGCIATGDELGLLEVVVNSDTMANISKAAGGVKAEILDSSVFTVWLREYNQTQEEFTAAVHRFVLSTAGYCVATYILGIGDRHNDNVMLKQDGCCFHIDFGHFLGNFKSKYGYKREKAPFVFTNQYAHVMGGVQDPQYDRFVDVCCHTYNTVRKHGHLLLALFTLMLSTGIPELRELEDIHYLRDMMSLEATDEEATAKMELTIEECRNSKRTKLNGVVHIMAH